MDKPFVYTQDRLVRGILKRMAKRADEGLITYGGTMEQASKPLIEWINDAQEELMDTLVYLEKVKIELKDKD